MLLQLFRKRLRVADDLCDDIDIAANDYTVLLENIPVSIDALNDDYDDDLKHFFENILKEDFPIEVVDVNLCYNLSEVQVLQKKKQEKISEKKKIILFFEKHQKY
jgi:hypothetical protein